MSTVPDPRAEAAFLDWPAMLAEAARRHPHSLALVDGPPEAERRFDFAAFDAAVDRVAATLQREGLGPGHAVAVVAAASAEYVFVYAGALRAGLAVAPLAPSSTPQQLADMLADCEARVVFVDADAAAALGSVGVPAGVRAVWLGRAGTASAAGPSAPEATAALSGTAGSAGSAGTSAPWATTPFDAWLAPEGARPNPVAIDPAWPFNIIYSSGTTGTPKGIVQPHAMRWAHIRRGSATGYGPGSVTLVATPLYSNTTLVALIPSLAWGGAVVLMKKFDALAYLQLAERHRATHTMLVPVQYQRLMAHPRFDEFDLSRFVAKFGTSAPFRAELKAEVLKRWPGGLTEYYGLTEGGATFILHCHLHPNKLHTVGPLNEGHEVRLLDEAGRALPDEAVRRGESGEIAGRSPGMMTGYHRQPGKTAEAEWFDEQGRRFLRTGDIGRFDEDGFLVLTDRRKDMVISGGFNIYPSDLEAVLRRHPAVAEAAVFGVPSEQWGETPVAVVVLRGHGAGDGPVDSAIDAEALREWANARLGKTQRLSALRFAGELPRSAIGKVLRRALRERWLGDAAPGETR